MYDAADQWTKEYTTKTDIMYPPEALIRILKGSYSGLKMPKPKVGDSVLDVGCGDGRNFPLLASFGMKLYGTEISAGILHQLICAHQGVTFAVGTCAKLPWTDASFDYEIAWNSCYYMGPDGKFEDHVAEMARVLKPGGWIICSVPMLSHEIFKGAAFSDDGYCTIRGDRFELRNGERFRWFEDAVGLEVAFSGYFHNFCYAGIRNDMFGHAYNWHVIVAQRT